VCVCGADGEKPRYYRVFTGTINEGLPPRSPAPLFKLPLEILELILQHIESESLAALALVNDDCLQLARSRQSVSIKLDYSDASLGLIENLLTETKQRMDNLGAVSSLTLGTCIRRITVATHPRWVSYRHSISLRDDSFIALPETEKSRLMVDGSNAFFSTYIPRITFLASKPFSTASQRHT